MQRKTFELNKETEQYTTLVEAINDLNKQFEELSKNSGNNNADDVKKKRENIRNEIGKLQSEIDKLTREIDSICDDKARLNQEINETSGVVEEKQAKLPQLKDKLGKTEGTV